MKPAVLDLLLAYIDAALELCTHSHGHGPFAASPELPKKELDKMKRALRDAIYHAEHGDTFDGEFTHIRGE
jgi:hypothetical protein